MHRSFHIILTAILPFIIISCSAGPSSAQELKAQKVPRIVYEIYPDEWYNQQAQLWKKELERNPASEEAWYNYYNASRYARFEDIDAPSRKQRLQKIIDDMNRAIPNTYTSHLLTYWNDWNIQDMSHVRAAYKINPQRPDTYYPFISEAKIKGDQRRSVEFCKKLYASHDIAPWLLNYNYNTLMSADENAVLITNGDNDTYPAWVIQDALNIRSDVTILNLSLLQVEDYFKSQLKLKNIELNYNDIKQRALKKAASGAQDPRFRSLFFQEFFSELVTRYPGLPVYLALTVYKQHYQPFEDKMFLVGLAWRYNPQRFDNIALIKRNLESRYRLDYLQLDFYSEDFPGKNLAARIQLNYVAPIMVLAEHYQASGEHDKMAYWKKLALQLAREANSQEIIEKINQKFR